MARSVLASLAPAASCAAALAWVACLPDLAALRVTEVAGEEAGVPAGACGDGFIEDDETCDPGEATTSTSCTGCQIACPPGGVVDDAGKHCYFALEPSESYSIAVGRCGEQQAHVVTFASDREGALVDGLAAGAPYWVGLAKSSALDAYEPAVPAEPGLPLPDAGASCPGCYARGADDAGALPAAVDGGADLDCVVARSGGWVLSPCSAATAHATICEREPPGSRSFFCQGPYCATVVVMIGKKRYLLDTNLVDADTATSTCAAYEGGRLVVLDSAEEREQLARELLNVPGVELPITAWIGLSSDGTSWTWDDGRPASDPSRPLPWGEAQPAAAAGAGRAFIRIDRTRYDSQLAIADGNATALRAFICERAP